MGGATGAGVWRGGWSSDIEKYAPIHDPSAAKITYVQSRV